MTLLTQRSSRIALATVGAVAIVSVSLAFAFAKPAHAASVCPNTWSSNLSSGVTNADVMKLQQFLNSNAGTMVASSGAGSPGMETNYFGARTKAAVMKFQAANNIAPVAGYVGPLTRGALNSLCGGTSVTPTPTPGPTTGGTAVVSAGVQPANAVAPKSASRVPFTTFTISAQGGPVTFSGATVVRQGASVDGDFSSIVLLNAATGVQVGISRVLDANHSATVGQSTVIPAGSSVTFVVAGNIASGAATADIASLAVTAINASSAVSGSLPIIGASNTFNANLTIGTNTATRSSYDPNTSANSQPIGTNAYRFSGIHLAADATEDQNLKSITWYQSGSATGIANVMTIINGTSYPTVADSTGRYFTSVFPNGILIPKGNSVDAYVQGDLGASAVANTTAEFDIYRATDVYLTGNLYGYGVTVSAASTGTYSSSSTHVSGFQATSNPWFFGSTLSVTAGTISTIQNATSVAAQNIAVNVPNQVLGGFQTNLTGEAITGQSLKFHFTFTSGQTAATYLMTNVTLVDENGSIIGGPYNGTSEGGENQYVTFTGSINFPLGTHTYTLKGQLNSSTPNGATIQASTTPSADWSTVTGNVTGNNITLPSSQITMNTMTVKAATLTVSNSTNVTSQTVVGGAQNFVFGKINLDASQSGEDLRMSSLPMKLALDGSLASGNDLSNCVIWNGTTQLNTGSRVINATNIIGTANAITGGPFAVTFSFDTGLTVPKGTITTLTLTCNLSSSATNLGTYKWGADSTAGNYSVTGVNSGGSVSMTGNIPSSNLGATMTASTGGTLAGSTDSSAPAYSVASGGATGVTLNVIKLRPTNEAVNLTKLGLVMTNATTTAHGGDTKGSFASSTLADLIQTYVYAGNNIKDTAGNAIAAGTLLGTATFTTPAAGVSTITATSTLSTQIKLPADTDATLVIKGDIADIGTNQAGAGGNLLMIDYNGAQGTGAASGGTINGAAISGSGVAGVRVFNTYPTFAAGPAGPTNPQGSSAVLKKFSITPNSAGPVGLYQLAMSFATSSATISNIKVFAYTDSAYSQPANVPNTSSGQFGTTDGYDTAATGGSVFTNATFTVSPVSVYFRQATPLQISAPMYFTVVADVAPAGSVYNWTISTTVLGDSSYVSMASTTVSSASYIPGPSMPLLLKATALTSNNLIWATNATTTNVAADNAFTNGYGIPGLPSTGL